MEIRHCITSNGKWRVTLSTWIIIVANCKINSVRWLCMQYSLCLRCTSRFTFAPFIWSFISGQLLQASMSNEWYSRHPSLVQKENSPTQRWVDNLHTTKVILNFKAAHWMCFCLTRGRYLQALSHPRGFAFYLLMQPFYLWRIPKVNAEKHPEGRPCSH